MQIDQIVALLGGALLCVLLYVFLKGWSRMAKADQDKAAALVEIASYLSHIAHDIEFICLPSSAEDQEVQDE